jgi:hypothetical protein
LHGKKIEQLMNLSTFPKDYYMGKKTVKSIKFVSEMKKGILNGPG